MARGRMLSKSLSTSRRFAKLAQRLGKLGEFGQALYPLIVAHSDDFGRLQGDPFTVRLLCFPTSTRREDDFASALAAMNETGLIRWYEVEGRRYVEIVAFDEHQTGLHKRTKSRFPDPPGDSGKFPERTGDEKGPKTGDSRSSSGKFPEIPSEENGTEENLDGTAGASLRPPRRDRFAEEFETEIRPHYPPREGDQRWKKALGHYRAARKAGEPLEAIREAVRAYAARCSHKGIVGTESVKQAGTFFGDEECRRAATWELRNGDGRTRGATFEEVAAAYGQR